MRRARLADLDALVAIEQACFTGDRLSRRSLRHLLTRGHAEILLVAGPPDQAASGSAGAARRGPSSPAPAPASARAYALLFYRRGSRGARLYSFAVLPAARRHGLGRRLLDAVCAHLRRRGVTRLRLEVRVDNGAAIALYERAGFFRVASWPGYYEDGTDAIRLAKDLGPG